MTSPIIILSEYIEIKSVFVFHQLIYKELYRIVFYTGYRSVAYFAQISEYALSKTSKLGTKWNSCRFCFSISYLVSNFRFAFVNRYPCYVERLARLSHTIAIT